MNLTHSTHAFTQYIFFITRGLWRTFVYNKVRKKKERKSITINQICQSNFLFHYKQKNSSSLSRSLRFAVESPKHKNVLGKTNKKEPSLELIFRFSFFFCVSLAVSLDTTTLRMRMPRMYKKWIYIIMNDTCK